jgi:hypothetical protein
MTSTSLSPTQSLLSLFSLHDAQPTMEPALSSIHSGLLSALESNSAIHSSILRLQEQINSQKSFSKLLVPTHHAESIRYTKLIFIAMALVIITLSIFIRSRAKSMVSLYSNLPFHLSTCLPSQ